MSKGFLKACNQSWVLYVEWWVSTSHQNSLTSVLGTCYRVVRSNCLCQDQAKMGWHWGEGKGCWKFVVVPSASSCTYAVYQTFLVEHELAPSCSTGYEPRALLGSVVLQVPLPLSHPSWLPYPPQFSMASILWRSLKLVDGIAGVWICMSC